MEGFIIVALLVGSFVYVSIANRRDKKRRSDRWLREKYGAKPKECEWDSALVCNYYDTCLKPLDVDEITWNDLNMDEVYARINNCDSSMGEEILYARLHNLSLTEEEDALLEKRIAFCEQEEERYHIEKQLSALGKKKATYYIPSYMQSVGEFAIHHTWFYRVLQILLVAAIVAAIVLHNSMGAFVLLGVFAINTMVYMVSFRGKYDEQIRMLATSMLLVTTARQLQKEYAGRGICDELDGYLSKFHESDRTSYGLEQMLGFQNGDAIGMLFDLVLGATMWQVMAYNKVMCRLRNHVNEYMQIYRVIGELDAAISIGSFRKSVEYTAIPAYTDEKKLVMEEIYHPLLSNPVANSMELKHNCVITGSNASGKSTFIKTVAVNVILAQSIHTCTARKILLPKAVMITSMAVRDDIMSGDSYFIREIKYLKRILDEISDQRLVICVIDEILRGTNTKERIAASKAIMEYLNARNCIAIVASHDKELTELEKVGYDNYHFTEQIGEGDVAFDYKLRKGPADSQNAIHLLDIMGFPTDVVKRARELTV